MQTHSNRHTHRNTHTHSHTHTRTPSHLVPQQAVWRGGCVVSGHVGLFVHTSTHTRTPTLTDTHTNTLTPCSPAGGVARWLCSERTCWPLCTHLHTYTHAHSYRHTRTPSHLVPQQAVWRGGCVVRRPVGLHSKSALPQFYAHVHAEQAV